MTHYETHLLARLQKAEKTLALAGYMDCGGELWKPPINFQDSSVFYIGKKQVSRQEYMQWQRDGCPQ